MKILQKTEFYVCDNQIIFLNFCPYHHLKFFIFLSEI